MPAGAGNRSFETSAISQFPPSPALPHPGTHPILGTGRHEGVSPKAELWQGSSPILRSPTPSYGSILPSLAFGRVVDRLVGNYKLVALAVLAGIGIMVAIALLSLRQSVRELESSQPPEVSSVVAQTRESLFTVHVGQGFGSGFVVANFSSPEGYRTALITNAHVVADKILYWERTTISVSQGPRQMEATLWEVDPDRDLAVIAIKDEFPPLPWASRMNHDPKVGEPVLAVGSPFGIEGTSTTGIISMLGPQHIWTDAAINPGNS